MKQFRMTLTALALAGMLTVPAFAAVPAGSYPISVDGVTYVPLGLFDALLGSREGAVTVTDGQISIQTDREGTQIPNPFTDCATLEEAAKTAGFSMTLPEGGYTFQVMPGHMIQASGDGLTIRKGVGSDDISGDYTSYPQTGTRTVKGLSLTWKGENDRVRVATWSKGDYTFSVSSETGLTMAELTALAGSVG